MGRHALMKCRVTTKLWKVADLDPFKGREGVVDWASFLGDNGRAKIKGGS